MKSDEEREVAIEDNAAIFRQRGLRDIVWQDSSGRQHPKKLAV
jgi:hypothetical protein